MDSLLDRFCRYVRVDTQADEKSTTYPSTPGQLELGRIVLEELKAMGLRDAAQDEFGIVMATIPATSPKPCPAIALIAHFDTSPETSGHNVKPVVHKDYDGKDIVLPGDRSKVLRVGDNPELAALKGQTILAVIMETAAYLTSHRDIPHGPIRLCFTCDEEVGHGVDHIDLKKLGASVGYTLDGGGVGEIDVETFSADLAVVIVRGVNIHPSIGKGRMVNAVRLAGMFLDRLPRQTLSPETTAEREGFLHPYRIEGGVAEVTMRVLLRDFDTPRLAEKADLLRAVARTIEMEFPPARIDVAVSSQYRNMADGLSREPRAVAFAEEAMRRAGLTPKRTIVRGGTDGSRLTELGLPTPNLSTGEHNLHSPLEWTCLEEMATAVKVLVELAQVWTKETL
ncbi:MAG: peptidase T [Planctomycetota bacterium]|nr:MAG: peptidase T [Planctomycetota bacterium]